MNSKKKSPNNFNIFRIGIVCWAGGSLFIKNAVESNAFDRYRINTVNWSIENKSATAGLHSNEWNCKPQSIISVFLSFFLSGVSGKNKNGMDSFPRWFFIAGWYITAIQSYEEKDWKKIRIVLVTTTRLIWYFFLLLRGVYQLKVFHFMFMCLTSSVCTVCV